MKWLKYVLITLGVLVVIAAGGFFGILPGYVDSEQNSTDRSQAKNAVSADAKALHKTLQIADLHGDTMLWNRDILVRNDVGHIDIPRMIEGNVALQNFTTVTKSPRGQNYESNTGDSDNITLLAFGQLWPMETWTSLTARALHQSDKLHDFSARSDGRLRIIRTSADLKKLLADRAAGQTVVGGTLGIEGAHALDGEMGNLQKLWDAGYRTLGLHHFFDNKLGGSLHGIGKKGLSPFGRDVVKKALDMGFILDVAHSSEQSALDALAMSDRPMIVSHTGVKGACNTHRNFTDKTMKAIAAKGGLVGIGFWDAAACDISPAGVARSIKYAIELLGEDHVSLGSDYDGSVEVSFDASELAKLTDALIKAGLSKSQIAKVMGGNVMRVFLQHLPNS